MIRFLEPGAALVLGWAACRDAMSILSALLALPMPANLDLVAFYAARIGLAVVLARGLWRRDRSVRGWAIAFCLFNAVVLTAWHVRVDLMSIQPTMVVLELVAAAGLAGVFVVERRATA